MGYGEANIWTMEPGTKEKLFSRKFNKAWFTSDSPGQSSRNQTLGQIKEETPGQLVRVGQIQAQTEKLKYATAKDRAREVAQMMEEDDGIETTVISKIGDGNDFTKTPEYNINAHRYNVDTLQVKEKKDKRGRNARPDGHWVVCKDMFGETVLKCTYPCQPPCRYTCKGTDNMKGHVNTVHIKKFMYCNICGRPYLSYRILKEHMVHFHKQRCYPCTIQPCNFKSVDTELIEEHYWEKHGTRDVPDEYRAIDPSKRLEWKDKRVKVNRNYANPRKGNPIPLKAYPPAVEKLIEQAQTETGEPVFICKICDHKVTKKQNLAAHIKVKHMDIQTKCPEYGCTFTSGYWYNIQAHLKKVHNWKEIDCMIPGCKFKTVEDKKMQLHLTKIHNAKYDESTHSLICFA